LTESKHISSARRSVRAAIGQSVGRRRRRVATGRDHADRDQRPGPDRPV